MHTAEFFKADQGTPNGNQLSSRWRVGVGDVRGRMAIDAAR
jgi:hypothetical protein